MLQRIKPRMRSKQDLRWLYDELGEINSPYIWPELWSLINLDIDDHYKSAMEVYGNVNDFELRVDNIWERMNAEEYVNWDYIAPDYNTLRQIRENAHGFTQTGLVVHYDTNGLAQTPRQEAMI